MIDLTWDGLFGVVEIGRRGKIFKLQFLQATALSPKGLNKLKSAHSPDYPRIVAFSNFNLDVSYYTGSKMTERDSADGQFED